MEAIKPFNTSVGYGIATRLKNSSWENSRFPDRILDDIEMMTKLSPQADLFLEVTDNNNQLAKHWHVWSIFFLSSFEEGKRMMSGTRVFCHITILF